MRPTRRYWEALAVAVVPAVGAVVFAEPLLLVATAGILGWLLAIQLVFVVTTSRLDEMLDVAQRPARSATFVDEPVPMTIDSEEQESPLDVTITAKPSTGLETDGTTDIKLGESTTFLVHSSVAGTHRLQQPRVRVTDPFGFFTESFSHGDDVELRVETYPLTELHIGQGGTALTHTVGEHRFDTTGAGTVPAKLREYQTTEPASRIDWYTTARIGEPYVREFEAEAARPAIVIFDARIDSNNREMLPGQLEYLRTAADAFITTAERFGDPLGCYAIDGDGIRQLTPLSATKRDYERTKQRLQDLVATPQFRRSQQSVSVHHRLTTFDTSTRYGRVLQSFATHRPALDAESNPLKAAMRTALTEQHAAAHVVIFTDDSDRGGVRDALAEARRKGTDTDVSVFVAPGVLFDEEPLEYGTVRADQYAEFEQFRRELTALDRVTAYEVGRESRIESVSNTREVS